MDVDFARSARDLAFSAFQHNRCQENWSTYRRYRNRARTVMRRAKRKFFSKLLGNANSAGIWKILKNYGCVESDNTAIDINVNDINNFFALNNSVQDNEVDFSQFTDTDSSFSFRCVSEIEVHEVLSKIKCKSVGVDEIPIYFIKLVFPYISDFVLHLVNYILTSSSFPQDWKTARVVPIPKSKNVQGPEDLRPISILPAISKIVEVILKNQILEHTSSLICDTQYAFRRGHSTTHLLLRATDLIRLNLNEGKVNVLISLDISKAFNSINFSLLINKLRHTFNFSLTACKLILSYLKDRTQFVSVNNFKSNLLSLYSGVPQGSVLGPLLFILYVNDLRACIDVECCTTFQFADDIFLLFTGRGDNLSLLENTINMCLNQFSSWASANHLTVNSTKSKALLFGMSKNASSNLNIVLGNNIIGFVEHHKVLGVTIDNELSFSNHIDILSGKICFLLRRIYASNLYMPLHVKKQVAHALLMSTFLYGIEIVSGCIGGHLSRLRKIVNAIVRFVYKIPLRSHISDYVKCFLGCSFNNFISYRILVGFYNVVKNGEPASLARLFSFSHSTRNPQLIIPRICRNIYARSFVVRIARVWNVLPHELRIFSHTNNVFKRKLRIHLAMN